MSQTSSEMSCIGTNRTLRRLFSRCRSVMRLLKTGQCIKIRLPLTIPGWIDTERALFPGVEPSTRKSKIHDCSRCSASQREIISCIQTHSRLVIERCCAGVRARAMHLQGILMNSPEVDSVRLSQCYTITREALPGLSRLYYKKTSLQVVWDWKPAEQ